LRCWVTRTCTCSCASGCRGRREGDVCSASGPDTVQQLGHGLRG
jgi:hypothetical protein